MAISVPTNFEVLTTLPIDSRTVVADIAARNAIVDGVRYDGLIVYVQADNKNYQLQNGIVTWVDISGSSGDYVTRAEFADPDLSEVDVNAGYF